MVATDLEIIVRQPGKPDRTIALVTGEVRAGRGEDNDVILPDAGVSRRHCRFLVGADGVIVVEDTGSGNGTWLRGKRIEGAQRLQVGDILLVDPFTLEIRGNRAARPAPPTDPKPALAKLDVLRGPSLAQGSYAIPAGGLSIGRSEYRDLVLLDPAASRHHADIVLQGGRWRLVDRGSSNGVYLNEQRVTDGALTHGDVVRIGNTELRFLLVQQGDSQGDVPTRALGPGEWSRDLSLPLPGDPQETPRAAAPRALPDGDTPVADHPSLQNDDSSESNPQTRPVTRPAMTAWLPLSLTAAAVALTALAATLATGVAVFVVLARPGSPFPPERPPRPPTWAIANVTTDDTPVSALFDQGVDAMRRREPGQALGSFWRVLVKEPGNPAAERWSFTAGEHLVFDTLEKSLDPALAARRAREADRDALLAEYPRPAARDALKERHRDDPVVLTRTGWAPSADEAQLARELDQAIVAANGGAWSEAAAVITDVLGRSRNPALKERARFARFAARRELARQIAPPWRAGVVAESRGDIPAAMEAYRSVLAMDPRNPSAKARLQRLEGAR